MKNVPSLAFVGEIVDIFAKLRADLFNTGNVIEYFDVIIAATAIANNATFVTNN